MPGVHITKADFLRDPQGKTFNDVAEDPEQPFEAILRFLDDKDRQRRMEESELHHDRPPLAGVVRELESQPAIDQFFSGVHAKRSVRLRQATGVLVRMIMEARGWKKSGRKGSLGVRAPRTDQQPAHNKGGIAFWFVRAERYEPQSGVVFRSVRQRYQELSSTNSQPRRKKASRP